MLRSHWKYLFAVTLTGGAFVLGRITAPQRPETSVSKRPASLPLNPDTPQSAWTSNITRPAQNSDLGTTLNADQLRVALKQLDQTAGCDKREDERLKLLVALAVSDPLGALEYAKQNLRGDRFAQAMSSIVTQWAKNDPAAAWNWARSNSVSQAHTVLEEISKNDPALAVEFLSGFVQVDSNEAVAMCFAAMRGMTYNGNFDAAKNLISQVPLRSPEEQALLSNFMAVQWARFEPEKAAEWVESLPEGPSRSQALIGLGASWAELDPPKAAEFAAQLPAGQERQTALRQAVASWVITDPVAASTWINEVGNHEDFDQAVATIATMQNLVQEHVDTALNWAERITNPLLRNATLGEIINNWASRDRAAALKYVQTSPSLSAETREQIAQEIQPAAQANTAQ